MHATALYAKHGRLCRAYYTDGREHGFNNATCLWVTDTLGKLQHALLRAKLGPAVCLMIGAGCLLVPWRLLELPRQGGTLAKGMAVELGPFDVAFSSPTESPQSSHLSSFLA